MDPIVAAHPGEPVSRDSERAPDRAEIREAILGRARNLSATWRAAWREAWNEEKPLKATRGRHA
jgi:hypothetical protein